MFIFTVNWLAGLFSRRNDRLLFGYWDGSQQRRIDPLVAWRGIHNHPDCNWVADMRMAANPLLKDGSSFYPVEEVRAAEDRLLALIRDVFGVREWQEDQPGLTIDETNELLGNFIQYVADLKKKRNPSPTPPAPSESTVPPDSVDSAVSPPSNWPDCSSTETASSAAAPGGPAKRSAPV